MVGVYLSRQLDDTPLSPPCGEGRLRPMTAGDPIPVGDKTRYPGSAARGPCSPPAEPGIYLLRYDLDPFDTWDEGADGEANNHGTFRSYYYHPG